MRCSLHEDCGYDDVGNRIDIDEQGRPTQLYTLRYVLGLGRHAEKGSVAHILFEEIERLRALVPPEPATPKRYRTTSEVEAMQWRGDHRDCPAISRLVGNTTGVCNGEHGSFCFVATGLGYVVAGPEAWIVRDALGRCHWILDEDFRRDYEEVVE